MKTETSPDSQQPTADTDANVQATAERAVLRLDAAKQRVQLAKEDLKRVKNDLKRARKRLKEAKREAKRARRRAEAAQKKIKRRSKKRQDGGTKPEAVASPVAVKRGPSSRTAANRRSSRVQTRRAVRAHRKRAT